MKTEPALTLGALLAVILAGLNLLTAFGVPITEAQHRALMAFVEPLLAIVFAIWIRSRVTPVQ